MGAHTPLAEVASPRGVHVRHADVAKRVCELHAADAGIDADAVVTPVEPHEWVIAVGGRVDDYLTVATTLADRKATVGSNDTVASAAARMLDDLHEYAADDRSVLAMLDLAEQYDLEDFDRTGLAERLTVGDGPAIAASTEVAADD